MSSWNATNEHYYQANLAFVINLFTIVFNSSTNHGIWVDADLGGEIVPPRDSNSANYETGHCGDLGYHLTYGKSAYYISRLWTDLATYTFFNGSTYFPGKNRRNGRRYSCGIAVDWEFAVLASINSGRFSPAFPMLTSGQVAKWLGVAPRTVCFWAECGDLPGIKIGRQWRFREIEIRRWIERRYVKLPQHL